ncbi:FdhE protein [Desulfomicrobium macestii]|uniref:FdhE protein n=1 Tax=Desulfomicrobium macestii TaxID=90731 RepID=A0ABR9H7G4_9BACT|nr:formate dehydrogenase accessory protein FdhE [Desulfomicrobium macestii]MBE1426645.1 FdhE protein [Desulfomicrobium macestii]
MPSTEIRPRQTLLNEMAGRHVAFREIIERFGMLLDRQAEAREELHVVNPAKCAYEEERFLGGEPLVAFVNPEEFGPALRQSASKLWPFLGLVFPPLHEALGTIGKRLDEDGDWLNLCLRAIVHGDEEALTQAAALAHVSPDFLFMALQTAYGPCITAHKEALLSLAPAELWRKPHCPVCGSAPDLATLECHSGQTDFLISKGGELWHHCSACSHHWRFVRLECPGCGNQDHKTLVRFSLPDSPREHIYACEKCRHYLPCLDLMESSDKVDLDLTALGLVHLDAVAQSKGYAPLSPAPWTALGLATPEAKAS